MPKNNVLMAELRAANVDPRVASAIVSINDECRALRQMLVKMATLQDLMADRMNDALKIIHMQKSATDQVRALLPHNQKMSNLGMELKSTEEGDE